MKNIIFILFSCLHLGCASNRTATADALLRQNLAKRVLADASSTPAAVKLAIMELDNCDISPLFWAELANNPQFSAAVHDAYLAYLWRHHVRPGQTVEQLSKVIGPAEWLKSENITEIKNFSGAYPVRIDRNDKLYVIHPHAGGRASKLALFLTFDNPIDHERTLTALTGAISEGGSRTVIKCVGIIDPERNTWYEK